MSRALVKKTYFMLTNHTSLMIIGLGSGIIFLCNILFEGILTKEDYGEYSILITFVGTIFNLGFLGLEKVFLRLGENKNQNIILNKHLPILLIIIGFAVIVSGSFYFDINFLTDRIPFYQVLLISAATVLSMLAYSFYRLLSKFIFAQLIINLWKFGLGVCAVLFLLFSWDDITLLFDLLTAISCFMLLLFFFAIYKLNYITENEYSLFDILKFWQGFAISILLLMFITYFERYYIKEAFGSVVLGEFFYLANIFLFPFHLLQNYTGFKKLIFFKETYSWIIFKKEVIKNLIFSVVLGAIVAVTAYILNEIGLLKIDFDKYYTLILIFLTLGTLKVYYALAEGALSARISLRLFNKVNIISLLSIGLIFTIGITQIITVNQIAALMCVLWAAICIIFTFAAKRIDRKEVV